MHQCERLNECKFFNETMRAMPGAADLMKNRFCLGDYSKCARLKVRGALGNQAVPADLAPNDFELASKFVAGWA